MRVRAYFVCAMTMRIAYIKTSIAAVALATSVDVSFNLMVARGEEAGQFVGGLVDCVSGELGVSSLQYFLLHEETQRQGGCHSHTRYGEHGGRVASVLSALADVGVVLLEDSAVAFLVLGVILPATATDNSLLATHVLVDFTAEVVLVCISWTRLQVIFRFRFIGPVFVEEWVSTVDVFVAGALMTLNTRTCGQDGEDNEKAGGD